MSSEYASRGGFRQPPVRSHERQREFGPARQPAPNPQLPLPVPTARVHVRPMSSSNVKPASSSNALSETSRSRTVEQRPRTARGRDGLIKSTKPSRPVPSQPAAATRTATQGTAQSNTTGLRGFHPGYLFFPVGQHSLFGPQSRERLFGKRCIESPLRPSLGEMVPAERSSSHGILDQSAPAAKEDGYKSGAVDPQPGDVPKRPRGSRGRGRRRHKERRSGTVLSGHSQPQRYRSRSPLQGCRDQQTRRRSASPRSQARRYY